jgi:hypothetical protein
MDSDMEEQERLRELFGYGRAGEPVPEVDAADIKAVLEIGQDMERRHPGGQYAVGRAVYENACKPGAIIQAVLFRASRVDMLRLVAPAVLDPLIQDKLDAVCTTAAQIPMRWAGATVHHGWTFDPNDFLRRVREA